MRIAVITQSKGGTGKTTTSVHLAAGLARAGKQVLLIDSDPQGNVSSSLGISSAKTLYHLYIERTPLLECVVHARENLDVLPADRQLAAVDQWLVMQSRREEVLRRRLEVIEGYDYVLIDTAPSFSLVGLNALMVAHEAWVPVAMEFLALEGLRQVAGNLRVVEEELKHKLPIHYVIPTFFDARHKKSQEVLHLLQEAYGVRVTTPVRADVRLSEAPSFHKTIFEHAPSSRGAADYQALIERIENDGLNQFFADRQEPVARNEGRLGERSGEGGGRAIVGIGAEPGPGGISFIAPSAQRD